jgi:hypothetical protein
MYSGYQQVPKSREHLSQPRKWQMVLPLVTPPIDGLGHGFWCHTECVEGYVGAPTVYVKEASGNTQAVNAYQTPAGASPQLPS